MFQKSIGRDEGLWLTPCNGIHTFFMRFDIDVIFLNRQMQVVRLCERLRPNGFGVICFEAQSVLEFRAGFISDRRVRLRHVLEFLPGRPAGPGPIPARFV